jgi:hypothetical protein
MSGHVWRRSGERNLGEWRIYVTEPLVSVFSTVPLYPGTMISNSAARQECARPAVQRAQPGRSASAARTSGPQRRPQRKSATEPSADPATEPLLQGFDLQACIAFAGLEPTRVLGFIVGENVTLGQSLRGDSAISAAVQRFESSSADRQSTAREICNLVAERADALGLNGYDAAAAVWAFAAGGALTETLSKTIWDHGCASSRLAKRLRLPELAISGPMVQVPADRDPAGPKTPAQAPAEGEPGASQPKQD